MVKIIWITGVEMFKSGCELEDGSLMLTGITNAMGGDVVDFYSPNGVFGRNTWIVKIDRFGNKKWAKCLTDATSDYIATDINETLDGKIVVCGASYPLLVIRCMGY